MAGFGIGGGGGGSLPDVGVRAVIKDAAKYAKDAGNLEKVNSRLSGSVKKLGRATAAAGVAVAALAAVGIGAGVKAFADFDAAMQQSLAIMGDVSDTLREDMTEAARDVAKETTFSAEQAAESYFFLASAGLSAEQSIAALPTVATFAQAGMFDMATATDLATDAQSALGLTVENTQQNIENLQRVTDVLVKANTLANATVEQFSQSLTREAGAALKALNKDVEEGVAVLAAFADQGIKGEVAGTGLSRIIRLVSQAATQNKEELAALNIEVFDAEGRFRNFADIIEDLEEALLPLSDAERTAALEAIGFSARVQGIILPLLGTSDAIREYEAALRDAGGTSQEVAEKQLQTFNAQIDLTKSRLTDLLITVGESFTPALMALNRVLSEDLLPTIEDRLPRALERGEELFREWRPAIEGTIQTVQDISDAVIAFGSWIIANEAVLVAAIVAIGAAFVWANPVTAAIVGTGGLIAAIGLLRTENEKLGESALEVKKKILEVGLAIAQVGEQISTKTGIFNLIPVFTGDEKAVDALFNKFLHADEAVDFLEGELADLDETLADTRAESAAEEALQSFYDRILAGFSPIEAGRIVLRNYGTRLDEAGRAAIRAKAATDPTTISIQALAQGAANAGVSVQEYAASLQATAFIQSAFGSGAIQLSEILAGLTVEFQRAAIAQAAFQSGASVGEVIRGLQALSTLSGGGVSVPAAPEIPSPGLPSALTGESEAAKASEEEVDAINEIWKRGALRWMRAIEEGIEDGTLGVEDALFFLERGATDAATSIIQALDAESERMARQWQVLQDAIERGFVTVGDINQLLDLGAEDAARDFMRAFEGQASRVGRAIRDEVVRRAQEAAEEFTDAFVSSVEGAASNIVSIIGQTLSSTMESEFIERGLAGLRLQAFELEPEAQAAQEARQQRVAELEQRIADIREQGAERTAELEEELANLRERHEREDFQEALRTASSLTEIRRLQRERERDLEEQAIQDQIDATQEGVDTEVTALEKEIEAIENLQSAAEREIEAINEQIAAAERLLEQRRLEHDIIIQGAEALDKRLKSEQQAIAQAERLVGLFEDVTGFLAGTAGIPTTAQLVQNAQLLASVGFDELAQMLLEIAAGSSPLGSAQHGAFVPAGSVQTMRLHGPEVVVPLRAGMSSELANALGSLVASSGSGGGLKNFGTLNVYEAEDSREMRVIKRALR